MFWTRANTIPFSATLGRQMDLVNRLFKAREIQPCVRTAPAFNLWGDDNGAVLTSEIPGVTLESLDIAVSGRNVTVKGSRKDEVEEGRNAICRERVSGEFERTFQLPYQIDAGKVEAKLAHGVLEIALPRAENDKPRKIVIS